MRRLALLFVTLACGELAPGPPAPTTYKIAYAPGFGPIRVLHSMGAVTDEPWTAGDACFTPDGTLLLGETGSDLDGNGPPQAIIVARGDALAFVSLPSDGRWGIRDDGQRLSWVRDGALRTYDLATNVLGPVIATGVRDRALYAGDDATLVFARALPDRVEIVTMRDDGTAEDVVATFALPDGAGEPSFSWDQRRVVFVAHDGDIVLADRATHALSTIATIDAGAWDPFLTPDDAAVIYVTATPDEFWIERLDVSTKTTEVLVKGALPEEESYAPELHISVAPDL